MNRHIHAFDRANTTFKYPLLLFWGTEIELLIGLNCMNIFFSSLGFLWQENVEAMDSSNQMAILVR